MDAACIMNEISIIKTSRRVGAKLALQVLNTSNDTHYCAVHFIGSECNHNDHSYAHNAIIPTRIRVSALHSASQR